MAPGTAIAAADELEKHILIFKREAKQKCFAVQKISTR
jgi:hypothetical protein